jgi:hypothetical protein
LIIPDIPVKHVLPAKLTNGEPGFNPGTGAKKKPEISPSDLKVSDLNGKDRSLGYLGQT